MTKLTIQNVLDVPYGDLVAAFSVQTHEELTFNEQFFTRTLAGLRQIADSMAHYPAIQDIRRIYQQDVMRYERLLQACRETLADATR